MGNKNSDIGCNMTRKKSKPSKIKFAIPIILAAIALSSAVYYVNFGLGIPATETTDQKYSGTQCVANKDCDWRSTNCCDENAGASWECVNLRNFSMDCSSMILCPQFISPKPQINCSCEQGNCVKK